MKATIMNIDACRNELAREILQINDIEVLKKVRQAYLRIRKQAESKAALVASSIGSYTQEKMLARIAESEADEADEHMSDTEEVFARMEQKYLFYASNIVPEHLARRLT